jgi:hypothetical protein
MHIECEKQVINSSEYITIPVLNKLLYIDYLFEIGYDASDGDYLFTKYGHIMIEKALDNQEWSIIVFGDEMIPPTAWVHLFELAERNVLSLQLFYENKMKE